MRRALLLWLAVLTPSLTYGQPSAPARGEPRPVDAETRRALDWALARGRLLFALDRVAWVTTDDMRERLSATQLAGIRGWVVDRDGDAYTAVYYAEENARRVAVYRARVENGRIVGAEVFQVGRRLQLNFREERLARAIAQVRAAAAIVRICSQARPNIAAVPPAAPDGPIDVYVMTPQTQTDVLPFGGHHRFTVSADGQITAQRRFTNGCLDTPIGAHANPPNPAALVVSHALDPWPTEIHVFTALAARLPITVVTGNGKIWGITGDSIELVDYVGGSPQGPGSRGGSSQ